MKKKKKPNFRTIFNFEIFFFHDSFILWLFFYLEVKKKKKDI